MTPYLLLAIGCLFLLFPMLITVASITRKALAHIREAIQDKDYEAAIGMTIAICLCAGCLLILAGVVWLIVQYGFQS